MNSKRRNRELTIKQLGIIAATTSTISIVLALPLLVNLSGNLSWTQELFCPRGYSVNLNTFTQTDSYHSGSTQTRYDYFCGGPEGKKADLPDWVPLYMLAIFIGPVALGAFVISFLIKFLKKKPQQ